MYDEIDNLISFENLGTVNKNRINIGSLTLWFSYKTFIAFSDEKGLKCCVNVWSNTTGKLLNEIQPNKENRLSYEEFKKELKLCLIRHNFIDRDNTILKEIEQ